MKYIVANWKANKTKKEVKNWLDDFLKNNLITSKSNLEVIIAAPYIFLPLIQPTLTYLDHLYLAAQDVSSYTDGPYTGQVTIKMLSEFVDYVLIGHSETKTTLHLTQDDIQKRIDLCQKYSITPIIFIADLLKIPKTYPDKTFFVYEPPSAISQPGKSNPASFDQVQKFIKTLKSKIKSPNAKFLYGGSVNSDNVADYLKLEDVDGVVPGRSSLDVKTFSKLLENAAKAS